MNNTNGGCRIRRYVLHGGDSPILVVTPIPCNYVSWRNLGELSVSVFTHPWDDGAFDTLGPGAQDLILAPPSGPPELHPRFKNDIDILHLKLDSNQPGDQGVVVVKFVF